LGYLPTITWELQKGQWYGGCKQCKAQIGLEKKYIKQEDLEIDLLAHIIAIAPKNGKVIEILKQALKESHSEEIQLHDAQITSINNQLVRVKQRMGVMYEDKLDSRITAEFYDSRLKEFDEEKRTLLSSLQKLESNNTEYYRVGFAIHELALKAKDIYLSEKATIEERRLLLSYAFSNISVLRGNIKPEYTKPFNFLAEWMPNVNKTLELQKSFGNKGLSSTFVPTCPIVLGYKDSNLDTQDQNLMSYH
jgi:site-specific DNA recombinase